MNLKNFTQINETVKEQIRDKLSKLLKIKKQKEIVFSPNSIYSINMITNGLAHSWRSNDLIVFPENELLKNRSALEKLQFETDCSLETVNVIRDGTLDLAHLEEILENSTGKILFFISHINDVTGVVQPIKELFSMIKEYEGTTILDCNNSIRQLSIDVERDHIDFLFFDSENTGAETGVGVFYGETKKLEKLHTLFDNTNKQKIPEKFEFGNINNSLLNDLDKHLGTLIEKDIQDISAEYLLLSATLLSELQTLDQIKILCPNYYKGGILSFYTENDVDLDILEKELVKFNVDFGYFGIDEFILLYSNKGVVKVQWDDTFSKEDMTELYTIIKNSCNT